MRKIVFITILTFLSSSAVFSCFGQTPPPTKTPVPSDADAIKISTTLIQIDVTVTDKNGKIISDLKAGDFEVFENGERQEITSFSFVSSESETVGIEKGNVKKAFPNAPLKPEQVRRTIALVVDDLTITYERFGYVKKSLRRFVDEQMRDGDFVAIARTGGTNGILQQFTGDRRQLYAAIEKLKWNPLGLGGAKFALPPDPPLPGADAGIGLRASEVEANEFRESSIAANMIGGIDYFISGMRNLPGRKSAIIFSEGFNLLKRDIVGPERSSRVEAALKKLFDTALRSSVVISTIDVRGLEATTGESFNDTQDGLIYLAEQTGGAAVINNNDFNLGIEKILNNQKSYYLLGYTPDAETFDAAQRRFNKLTVRVKRDGATARYRSGFFGAAEESDASPGTRNPSERLRAALVSPFAVNDIALTLNTLFGHDGQDSFVRSLLHINAKDLKFTDEADGSKKAVFDVLALSFNAEGGQVDKIVKPYEIKLPLKEYERLQAAGFVYYFTFPFKKPGAYQFRVAIRDKQSDKIGSASQFVEIPNLKKGGLTLSGVVLENLTPEQWQREAPRARKNTNLEEIKSGGESDPWTDTSVRRFKHNTVLRYGFEVYNAKLDAATRKPDLTTQINVWRDGKLIFSGKPAPVDSTAQKNGRNAASSGALVLGGEMPPGDYVLQIVVTDNLVKGRGKSTEQFVQFEIV
jgi:VWFA-related protein